MNDEFILDRYELHATMLNNEFEHRGAFRDCELI